MIKLLVYIKHHLTFIWRIVELINSILVRILWSHKFRKIPIICGVLSVGTKYNYRILELGDIESLHYLLNNQNKDYLNYFSPHKTDLKTLKKIVKNYNYLTFGCFDGDKLVGYFFLRLFFTRRAFIGRLVDENYQGKGIAKQMSKLLYAVADEIDFPIYSTISKKNIGSLKSHQSVRKYTVVKELKDNYLLIKFDKQ